jgi:hypothetical protein
MKQLILALCVFIASATVGNAGEFYKCLDKEGNTILTDSPPPGAKCESMGGDDYGMSGESDSVRNQMYNIVDRLESTSQRRGLRDEECQQQTELLEELSLSDTTGNVRQRINDILNRLERTSQRRGLRYGEVEQQTRLLKLQKTLRNAPAKGNMETRSKQYEIEPQMKQRQKKESASENASKIGQCMGDCANEQGICFGECRGDAQCGSRCARAHGRCVSKCH